MTGAFLFRFDTSELGEALSERDGKGVLTATRLEPRSVQLV
jgi:hypothetical protein